MVRPAQHRRITEVLLVTSVLMGVVAHGNSRAAPDPDQRGGKNEVIEEVDPFGVSAADLVRYFVSTPFVIVR